MIIDAFMYFNELDILEIRLNELDSVVDKFVIVESLEMHGSANKKTKTLMDNWEVVRPFQHKVQYRLLHHLTPPFSGPETSWPRENFNRDALMLTILDVSTSLNDIVMISDCDEIPKASTIKGNAHLLTGMTGTEQHFFYYNVNTYGSKWHGTVLGRVSDLIKEGGPQAVRNQRDNYPRLRSCGWHFSYFGGIERIRAKTQNFAHASDPICRDLAQRSDEELALDIASSRDLYHRENENFVVRKTGEIELPEYLTQNKERFKHFYAD